MNTLARKKILIAVFGISIVAIAASLTYVFLINKSFLPKALETRVVANREFAESVKESKKPVSFVLLGHGGSGHSGGDLMDSIILVTADLDSKKALVVSVPRDLFIEGRKVNEGFVAGGYDLVKHQVNTITGYLPEHYVSVDFDSFKKLIDLLGGIEVKVPKLYEDKYYPIKGEEINLCGKSPEEVARLHTLYSGYQLETQFECRYEMLRFEPGTVHMSGDTALKYVRSRHGDGDFGRSERQFVVLEALKSKVLSLQIIPKFGPVFKEMVNVVKTDLSARDIAALAELFHDPESYDIKTIHLTSENVLTDGKGPAGQYILLPREGRDKWTQIKNFVPDIDE